MDPADAGDLPTRLLPLSRDLGRLLRYKDGLLRSRGIEMDREGWVQLTEVLALPDFDGFDVRDVRMVVDQSFSKDQPRFEIRSDEDNRLQIRAAHKRPVYGAPRGEYRRLRRAQTPEPPDLDVQFEDAVSMSKNKMRGPKHFDISEDSIPLELPENFSSMDVEWERYELDSNIFAWWCERADGTQDGFAELAPEKWDLLTPEECEHIERPCWINGDTGEHFFISRDMASAVQQALAKLSYFSICVSFDPELTAVTAYARSIDAKPRNVYFRISTLQIID